MSFCNILPLGLDSLIFLAYYLFCLTVVLIFITAKCEQEEELSLF